VTGTASSVGAAYATLNATVDPNGGQVTSCRFEYGTSASYGESAPCASVGQAGESPVAASAAVPVHAKTTYHFRVVATNAGGVGFGGDETFATPAPALPRVESSVTWNFEWSRRYTVVRSLIVHGVPKHGHVEISCSGQGCPFTRRHSATVARRRCRARTCTHHHLQGPTVSLAGLFKGRHVSVGTRISVSVVNTGWVGRVFVFTVRTNGPPTFRASCLAPNSNRPGRGC
jgi:hypothetical protein